MNQYPKYLKTVFTKSFFILDKTRIFYQHLILLHMFRSIERLLLQCAIFGSSRASNKKLLKAIVQYQHSLVPPRLKYMYNVFDVLVYDL